MATSCEIDSRPLFPDDANDLPSELLLELSVHDHDTIAALCDHEPGKEREDYALHALRIGVLALRHARGQLDAELVRRESQRMLADLQGQLGLHSRSMQDSLSGSLREYFDPENGRFPQRVESLVKRDGELEQLLRRQIGGQDSELVKTLVSHVGQQSPLFKLLDPRESQGLLSALRTTLDEELAGQREKVLSEFSLDNKQGALARLLDELAECHGQLTDGLQKRIDEVVKQFSLDEENSALSRLVKNVDHARRTITSEFSLDNEQSAFSRLRVMLESNSQAIHSNLTLDDEHSALARLKRELFEIIRTHGETQAKFQLEVTGAIKEMAARKAEKDRGTRHGEDFEAAVVEYVQRLTQEQHDCFEHVGARTGIIRHCKTGDCVIELGPDTRAPGARIVIEAKQEAGYTQADARKELDEARRNRGAEVGLFVYSKRVAPAGQCELERLGNDVFVVWDAEDPSSDLYLKAALMLCRGMCVVGRKQDDPHQDDFVAIDKALATVQKEIERLDKFTSAAETIKRNADEVAKNAELMRSHLDKQVTLLEDRIGGLRQALGTPAGE
ncbi:MAG: hypothetical protein U0836_13775 [Pirellulales bacterium]